MSVAEDLEALFGELCTAKASINYMLTKRRFSRSLLRDALERSRAVTQRLEGLLGPGGEGPDNADPPRHQEADNHGSNAAPQ